MGVYGSPQLGPYAEIDNHNNNRIYKRDKRAKALRKLKSFIILGTFAFAILMTVSYNLVEEENRYLREENKKLYGIPNQYKNSVAEYNNTTDISEKNIMTNAKETKDNLTLSGAGNYYTDKDFDSGTYNIEYIEGTGMTFALVNKEGQWVNATVLISVFNIDSDTRSYKGAVLKEGFTNEGTRIKITGNLKIRLQKVD